MIFTLLPYSIGKPTSLEWMLSGESFSDPMSVFKSIYSILISTMGHNSSTSNKGL